MKDALVSKFAGKKRAPKFADEGPPDMESTPRGSGAGAGDGSDMSPPDDGGDMGAPGSDPGMPQNDHEQALDDLADVIGVGPQDREDFGNALKAYIQACLAETLGGGEGGPPGGSEMPPAGGEEGGDAGGY